MPRMDTLWYIIAIVHIVVGTLFGVVGVLGFIRLPDVYTRLHATGKVSVFGVALLTVADMVITPLSVGKGLVLIVLLLLAGPVVSHAFASAALRIGIKPRGLSRNDLPPTPPTQTDAPPDAHAGK